MQLDAARFLPSRRPARTSGQSGDVDGVAGPGSRARQNPARPYRSERRHVGHPGTGRPRDVAANQCRPVLGSQAQETVEKPVDGVDKCAIWQGQREHCRTRLSAHRRQVAQIHGQRTVAGGLGCDETPVEVDTFDNSVHRDDVQRASCRDQHCGVVAGADDDPGGKRDPGANSLDQGALAEFADGLDCQMVEKECAPDGARVKESPRFAVWGGRMNLRLAGGTAVIGRASGFLNTEACTTHGLAIRLVVTLAQTSLRKPSRAKQELSDLSVQPG